MTTRLLYLCVVAALSAVIGVAQNNGRSDIPPLSFEPNLGQTAPSVAYLVQEPSRQVFLNAQSITYSIPAPKTGSTVSAPQIVRFNWAGDAQAARFTPKTQLAGTSNYFLKPHASEGISNVPHFGALTESDAMPGVSILFHSNARRELEFDFRVGAGADLRQVAYRIDGADKIETDKQGTLHLFGGGRELMSQPQPLAYEVREGKNVPLAASYVVSGTTVGFSVTGWSGRNQLVIDPVVAYGSYFGVHDPLYRYADEGGPNTWGLSTAVDPLGNMYIAGQTYAFDIPITPGAYMTECPWTGAACVYVPLDYVAKLSASGALLYSTYLGGGGYDPWHAPTGKMIAVDANGYAYVVGADGDPTTTNAYMQTCPNGQGCATLTKLNQDGSALVYSTYFGGLGGDQDHLDFSSVTYANGVALGPNGDVIVVGGTRDGAITTTSGAYQASCPTYTDGSCMSGWVASFDTNTNGRPSLVFATYLGVPNGRSEAESVATDKYGDVYVVGQSTIDLPSVATFGTGTVPDVPYQGPCWILQTSCETFVVKLDGVYGQETRKATMVRGAAAWSIAVDSSLNTFITGLAINGLKTTSGAFQTTYRGGTTDGFVTKIDPSGSHLLYSTFLGGKADDVAYDIAVNNAGMAFVTGGTTSTDFPLGKGAFQKTPGASFVTALNADGKSVYYSSYFGAGFSSARGIAVDSAWNAIVTGTTDDGAFPVTPGAIQTEYEGFSDAFVAKIVIAGDLQIKVKTNVTSIAKNGTVTYNAQVFNAGPDGSDYLALTNAIPSGMAFAGATTPNGNGCTLPKVGATSGTITCRKTRLEAGQTWYVNVYLKAVGKSKAKIVNTMKTLAQTQDLWQSNNTVSSIVQIK